MISKWYGRVAAANFGLSLSMSVTAIKYDCWLSVAMFVVSAALCVWVWLQPVGR